MLGYIVRNVIVIQGYTWDNSSAGLKRCHLFDDGDRGHTRDAILGCRSRMCGTISGQHGYVWWAWCPRAWAVLSQLEWALWAPQHGLSLLHSESVVLSSMSRCSHSGIGIRAALTLDNVEYVLS
jgi:hypothetical protein